MKIITTITLIPHQKATVFKIWNAEYPVKLQIPNLQEFDNFLDTLTGTKHYLLIDDSNEIVGWAALFSLAMARCFFIMLSGEVHGKGYGTMLLNELKKERSQLFGWVIDHNNDVKADGRVYPSPLNFYIKNCFTVNTEMRLETDELSAVNIAWEADSSSA